MLKQVQYDECKYSRHPELVSGSHKVKKSISFGHNKTKILS